jgi:hypothetical protein
MKIWPVFSAMDKSPVSIALSGNYQDVKVRDTDRSYYTYIQFLKSQKTWRFLAAAKWNRNGKTVLFEKEWPGAGNIIRETTEWPANDALLNDPQKRQMRGLEGALEELKCVDCEEDYRLFQREFPNYIKNLRAVPGHYRNYHAPDGNDYLIIVWGFRDVNKPVSVAPFMEEPKVEAPPPPPPAFPTEQPPPPEAPPPSVPETNPPPPPDDDNRKTWVAAGPSDFGADEDNDGRSARGLSINWAKILKWLLIILAALLLLWVLLTLLPKGCAAMKRPALSLGSRGAAASGGAAGNDRFYVQGDEKPGSGRTTVPGPVNVLHEYNTNRVVEPEPTRNEVVQNNGIQQIPAKDTFRQPPPSPLPPATELFPGEMKIDFITSGKPNEKREVLVNTRVVPGTADSADYYYEIRVLDEKGDVVRELPRQKGRNMLRNVYLAVGNYKVSAIVSNDSGQSREGLREFEIEDRGVIDHGMEVKSK